MANETSILDAIGGAPTVAVVVDAFYERLTHDPLVQHHFQPERLPALKAAQRAWFVAVLSGAEHLPSDLGSVHAKLAITDEQVAAVLGHLDAVLTTAALTPRLKRAILSLVGRLWYARKF